MRLAVLFLTAGGKKTGELIAEGLNDCHILSTGGKVSVLLQQNWHSYDGFICIMAAGIVVRSIAPLLKDKKNDPCVVVLDEKGSHVISLLSGHLGGGNSLAHSIAAITKGEAVITTASDTRGYVALDLWAAEQGLRAEDDAVITRASSLLVNNGGLNLYTDAAVDSLPPGITAVTDSRDADLVISHHQAATPSQLFLHPQNLIIGVGCNRGTPLHEFEEALEELFSDLGLSTASIRNLASIDVKNDEAGLLDFAEKSDWPIDFFSRDQINTVTNVTVSNAALKAVGAIGVAEPTALLSAKSENLLCRKRKWQNITMAVAAAHFTLSAQVLDPLNT